MGLFGFGRNKKEEAFRNHPVIQQMVSKIERYGTYDGSMASKSTAQRVFDSAANNMGCANPHTKTLYWETLESSNLPMPLAAAYAFSIGEFLEMPWYDPVASGGNTHNAYMNAEAMGIAFPAYKAFVERRHSTNETRYILVLSSNIIENY